MSGVATAKRETEGARRRPAAVFASAGDEERRRRTADGVTLAAGLLIVLVGLSAHHHPTQFGTSVSSLLASLPEWIATILGGGFVLAGVYAVVLIVLAALARDRWGLVRDLVLAVAAAAAACWLATGIIDDDWTPALAGIADAGEPRFPVFRVAIVTAVAATAAAHVIRPVRRLGDLLVVASAVGAVSLQLGLIADVVGAFGIGIATAGVIHLVFGSPAGAPSLHRIGVALRRLGFDPETYRVVDRNHDGALVLDVTDTAGAPFRVKVYGRDAAETQLVNRLWHAVLYRDAPRVSVNRTQQVEHEALLTMLGNRAGVSTAPVLAMGTTSSGDELLVTGGEPEERMTGDALDVAWADLERMRAASLIFGAVDDDHVGVVDGELVWRDWSSADFDVHDARRERDVAALLVLTAMHSDAEQAARLARTHVGDAVVTAAIPYIQTAALSPALRRRVKQAKFDVDALGKAVARALEVDVPQLVQVRRITWGRVAITLILFFAVYLLLSQLADIGWDNIVDSFKAASWEWLLLAFFVAQTPRVAQGVTTAGAAPSPIPLPPPIALNFSLTFLNLVMPSSAARAALMIRFFQKQGMAVTTAVTCGALDSISGYVAQFAILFIVIGAGWSSLDFSLDSTDTSGDIQWVETILLIGIAVVVLTVVIVLASSRLRSQARMLLGHVREALRGLANPRRITYLLGGAVSAELLFAITLGICCQAFGEDIGLANLLVINIGVSLFAGLFPVPGGVGVAEAALMTGLVAGGVSQSDAIAITIMYRMFTTYLPPIWGAVALRWLRRNAYV